jgi:hypothetical protein
MQRRTFLASLIATAVLDPERLLWVPGRKTISIPSPREWLWINLRETQATGLFSNGGRFPGDVVTYMPLDELSAICKKAYENHKTFCRQTFGKFEPLTEAAPMHIELPPGPGVWVETPAYHERHAWVFRVDSRRSVNAGFQYDRFKT